MSPDQIFRAPRTLPKGLHDAREKFGLGTKLRISKKNVSRMITRESYNFSVYMKCMIEGVRSVERASSSDVFVHELAVEF